MTGITRSSSTRTSSLNRSNATQQLQRSTTAQRTTELGHTGASSFGGSNQLRSSSATRAIGHTNRSSFQSASATGTAQRGTLQNGSRNESVRALQTKLRGAGFDPGTSDGIFGPKTERAVREFQRSQGLRTDGIAGRNTFAKLDSFQSGATTGTPGTQTSPATGTNGTASINTQPSGVGMATGTITVNGNTYNFNSGGRSKYSTPQGEYRVTAHRNSRSDAGFTRDGVGFSFLMEDKRRPGSDQMYDSRAGRNRTNLRIHPDGGSAGTAGCIGVVGDAATLRQFRADMNAELARNGGSYTLRVN